MRAIPPSISFVAPHIYAYFKYISLFCLVELDEYEDAAEIAENNAAAEVAKASLLPGNLLKNNEIPENKLDVATPTNPEQLKLEVN